MVRLIRTFCALGIVAAGTMIAPVPAQAAAIDALCPLGSDDITFEPGIVLLEPRLTTMSADFRTGECTTSVPGITSATLRNSGLLMRTCNDLLGGGSGIAVLTWNDGTTTSTVAYTQTAVRGTVATVVTRTGTITGGLFAGDSVVVTETFANLQFLACATPTGMTHTSGVAQTVITGP